VRGERERRGEERRGASRDEHTWGESCVREGRERERRGEERRGAKNSFRVTSNRITSLTLSLLTHTHTHTHTAISTDTSPTQTTYHVIVMDCSSESVDLAVVDSTGGLYTDVNTRENTRREKRASEEAVAVCVCVCVCVCVFE
jgi:hypothetical protein